VRPQVSIFQLFAALPQHTAESLWLSVATSKIFQRLRLLSFL